MATVFGRMSMKVLTVLIGIPVGVLTKKVVARAWTAARPEDPPHGVRDREARWADVIGYAALGSAGAVTAKLLTRKGAEQSYRTLLGTEPPPPPPTKAEKKLAKARKKAEAEAATAP